MPIVAPAIGGLVGVPIGAISLGFLGYLSMLGGNGFERIVGLLVGVAIGAVVFAILGAVLGTLIAQRTRHKLEEKRAPE